LARTDQDAKTKLGLNQPTYQILQVNQRPIKPIDKERKMKKLAVVMFFMLMAVTFTGIRSAHAEEITCTGTLGAITVDNVLVPAGATCVLEKTRVQGTVYVENNATLRTNRARITGNVQGEGAKLVRVVLGTVGGSIQVVQGDKAFIDRVSIEGDILFDSNDQLLTAKNNIIGGNLRAFQNTGGVTISTNTIDGNLQCTGNSPAPTGGGNIVHGSKENQCANL
jgi:hypothetical protein